MLMNREPIAIIGVGIRYPNYIDNLDKFWDTLVHKRSLISAIPETRFQDIDTLVDIDRAEGKIVTNQGAWIENVENFDADFFNISPREAEKLDPHQRLILEVTFQAMEDAGVKMEDLWGSLTGVFAGMWVSDFEHVLENSDSEHDVYSTTGSGRYAAAGRVSFFYNLQGPSITVDTACSTSLVATHLAVQSLQNHECNAAICTAANVLLDPYISICYSRSNLLSDYGRCRFGAEDAKGYVRCEGSAAILLKRLSDAERDGNHIYAIIPGTACNNDGQSDKYMLAPSAITQTALIRKALHNASIDNRDVQYIEAHGTGTNAGDPIELSSIPGALEQGRTSEQRYYVGSAKTIFGHTEAVAGFTGMIKCLMAINNRVIPGNLYAEMPKNPKVPWSELLLSIPVDNTPWPQPEKKLIAGVNAFGITGTNAHILLQEAPTQEVKYDNYSLSSYVFPISAASEIALSRYLKRHIEEITHMDSDAVVFNYVKNIACRKTDLKCRIAVVFSSRKELLTLLPLAIDRNIHENIFYGTALERSHVSFVFPGQGSQWQGMGAELYQKDEGFRHSIDKCSKAFSPYITWDLKEVLFDNEERLTSIDIIQPAIIAIEIAIAEWMMDKGVQPYAVVGHSMGEVASAYIAGIITLEEAAKIICTRSSLMKRTSGKGAMLYAAITQEQAQELLSGKENQLSIGVSNSPMATVISGDLVALDDLQKILDQKGIFCRKVKVDVASHSPHMDALKDELFLAVEDIIPTENNMCFYSTVLGRKALYSEIDAQYWLRNLRNSVQFGTTIQALCNEDNVHFIECSPHPVLVQAMQENFDYIHIEGSATATLLREKPEVHSLLSSLAQAYTKGVFVDWRKLYGNAYIRITMPTYPWQRERHWIKTSTLNNTVVRKRKDGKPSHPLLQQYLFSGDDTYIWQTDLSVKHHSYLADHKINETITLPAAAFIEMISAAAEEAFATLYFSIQNIQFHNAIVLTESNVRIKISIQKNIGSLYDCFLLQWNDEDNRWTVSATATIEKDILHNSKQDSLPLDVAKDVCEEKISGNDHYKNTASIGLPYINTFRVVQEISTAENISVATIKAVQQIEGSLSKYLFHPAMLDGCLQVLLSEIYGHPHASTFVPISVGRYSLSSMVHQEKLICLCRVVAESHNAITANLTIYDNEDHCLAKLEDVVFERLEKSFSEDVNNLFYDIEFEKIDISNSQPLSIEDIVFVGNNKLTSDLALACKARYLADVDALVDASKCIIFVSDDAEKDIPVLADMVKVILRNQALPRVYVISQNLYHPDTVSKQTMWIGFHRVFCNEHPEFRPTLIDFSGEIKDLLQCILSDINENELHIREDGIYAARLCKIDLSSRFHVDATSTSQIYEAATHPGMIDNIVINEKYMPVLGMEDVRIKVNSVGINFMNLMSALGIYPGKDNGFATLGIELCGTVVAIGSNVTLHSVGDRVMGMGYHTMASYIHSNENAVIKIPKELSWEEASTMPVGYLTAYYSLITLGKLSRGERVLIHAATGGVGLAAIYIAKEVGAEIYATAGSEEKRDYLKNVMGISHVYNSRDIDFYDKIRQDTGNEGIDVVLNSLTGEQMWLSMRLLRSFGRFIEIGKKDIYENSKLGLEIFSNGLSYHMVDFEKILIEQPQRIYQVLQEIVLKIDEGSYKPLPCTRFGIADIQKAFTTMATAKSIGKIVVDIEDKPVDITKDLGKAAIDSEGFYIITGGYGGIGITYMKWLVASGAQHIVLTGRNLPPPWAQQIIDEYVKEGLDIRIVRLDVADKEKVNQTIHTLHNDFPIRGVIHLAGILDDASIANFDILKFKNTLSPKVSGAIHLHDAIKDISIDFFVMMSSSALLFGSPGQSSYAAANAFMDGLAVYRHSQKLPALSINLGTVSSIGMAASAENRADRLSDEGISPLSPEDCVTILIKGLESNRPVIGAFYFDVQKWQSTYKSAATNPFLSHLTTHHQPAGHSHNLTWREQMLSITDKQDMLAAIENTIKSNVSTVVKLAPEKIAAKTNFKSLGIDSLMSIQLKNKLEAVCDVPISVTSFWTYSTIKDYAIFLAEKIGAKETTSLQVPAPVVAAIAQPSETIVPNIDDIADEDISKLLEDELRDLLAD